MKSTGIVRCVDDLGRIVLPKELRRTLGIEQRDSLEIFIYENSVILRKYEPQCTFCRESEDIIVFRSKNICKKCIKEINKNSDENKEQEQQG